MNHQLNLAVCSGVVTLLLATLRGSSLPAQPGGNDWSDRKEYDLVLKVRAEGSPQKRLALLDSWEKAYPKSKLSQPRLELFLTTYELLGDREKMFDTARQMLTEQPGDVTGLYWCTVLIPQIENPSAAVLDTAENAAKSLLVILPGAFAVAKKPESMSTDQWDLKKSQVQFMALRALGWISWQRGNSADAEEKFQRCLQQDPDNSEIAAWLGILFALESDKQIPALWQLARATVTTGQNSGSTEQRRQVNSMLETVYVSYHGGTDGLDELKQACLKSPTPPVEFSIDSAAVVAAKQAEAQLRETNPELAAWLGLRRELERLHSESDFVAKYQSQPLPKLKGTVLGYTAAQNSREVVVSITDANSAEVLLKLSSTLNRRLVRGTVIRFQGIADSFTANPFKLGVVALPGQIEVLPKSGSSTRLQ